jgi:hypothetical protein
VDYGRGDGAGRVLVVLAAGDAAGFCLCDGDDGGQHFVGGFGDGAEGFGFGYGCSLWDDLVVLSACLACLYDVGARRTVIVLDLVKAEVTVFVLVAVSVTTWVDVELTMGVVVAPIVIVGVNLNCVSLILHSGEEVC